MEELVKQTIQKIIIDIGTSLQKGNYRYSNILPSEITDFSLIIDSERGVFIGEVLEAIIMEYASLFRMYVVPNTEKDLHSEILSLISEVKDSISSDDDQKIYSTLSKLRFYVTKQQKAFPLRYKQRDRGESFF